MPTSKIKKWIDIPTLVAIIIALALLFSYVLNPMRLGLAGSVDDRDVYVVAGLDAPKDSMDVVVFGNSQATVLFNTKRAEEQGISSFVVAQGGQSVSEAYFTLKELLKKQHPKVAIVETDMICEKEITPNSRTEIKTLFNTVMYHFFPVLRYHTIWKQALGVSDEVEVRHYKGFEERPDVNPYTGGEYMFSTEEKSTIPVIRSIFLDAFVDLCEENDIRIVLVSGVSPMYHSMDDHNYVEALSGKIDAPYIDMNLMRDELGIDFETDSLDGGDHVNLSGSNKETDYLIQFLKDNYEIGDMGEQEQ